MEWKILVLSLYGCYMQAGRECVHSCFAGQSIINKTNTQTNRHDAKAKVTMMAAIFVATEQAKETKTETEVEAQRTGTEKKNCAVHSNLHKNDHLFYDKPLANIETIYLELILLSA